jgi:microsomal dipeptidase-like Zn-dependent dipeptidase
MMTAHRSAPLFVALLLLVNPGAAGPETSHAQVRNPGRTAPSATPIWGFADLHVHQFNNFGFGGLMLWGQPYGPMEHALQECNDPTVHGSGGAGDLFGSALALMSGAGGVGHGVNGHPNYTGWPRWNTFSHQQVYADWLKRAHDGGLQLMVMLAGNNPAICATARKASGRTCDDMEALDLQIQQAKEMESWIDNQSGGQGRGWYRIVYSPKQAREAIAKGHLAVVLGAEIPGLFGCRLGGGCTYQTVRAELQKYHALGLRQLNPIHNADNAFGGSAVYEPAFNLNNRVLAGDYFQVRDCSGDGVEFNFGLAFGTVPAQARGLLSTIFGQSYNPPSYPAGGHCNSRGLSQLGDFFVRELMHRRMLIDVDHMSWLTLDATLSIAEQFDYPVLASHTGFLEISRGEKRSEGQKRVQDLQRIQALGGIVAAITHQGKRAAMVNPASPIKHDCGNSSQSFAQAYLHAVWQTGFAPVGLGSDFNGFAGQPSPRFGPEACNNGDKGSNPELNGRISYPIPVHGVPGRALVPSVVGSKTFDYNVDGLAHIGMLPDLIQDLKQQGMTNQELEPLFRSAEGYIRMWEKIESKAIGPATIPVTPELVLTVTPGPPSGAKASVTVTASDKASGAAKAGTVQIGLQRNPTTGPTGQAVYYVPCFQVDPADTEFREAVPCPGTVTVAGYPSAKFDAPNPNE